MSVDKIESVLISISTDVDLFSTRVCKTCEDDSVPLPVPTPSWRRTIVVIQRYDTHDILWTEGGECIQ